LEERSLPPIKIRAGAVGDIESCASELSFAHARLFSLIAEHPGALRLLSEYQEAVARLILAVENGRMKNE